MKPQITILQDRNDENVSSAQNSALRSMQKLLTLIYIFTI